MNGLEEDIRFVLGQISGQLGILIQQGKIQDDRTIALEARLRTVEARPFPSDFEDRLRKVEGRQHWYAGAAAAMSAAATWLANRGFHL